MNNADFLLQIRIINPILLLNIVRFNSKKAKKQLG